MYCYPLTVADQHTRYLLACHGLLSTKGLGVRPVFDRLFREYRPAGGIRTDMASHLRRQGSTACRSSMSGGCRLRHSAPAITHRLCGLIWKILHQRVRLSKETNQTIFMGADFEVDLRTGGAMTWSGPGKDGQRTRYVTGEVLGTFRFKKRLLFIANALKQHTIGLEEVDDGIWSIHFCRVLLTATAAPRVTARCGASSIRLPMPR